MKKKRILFTIPVIVLFSCSKNDDPVIHQGTPFPNEVAAHYIALAFSNATCGLNYHMERCAQFAMQSAPGSVMDTDFVMKITDTAAPVQYLYAINYFGDQIGGSSPKYSFNYSAPGSFITKFMDSQDHQYGTYSATGMTGMSNQISLTGSGNDGGSQQSDYYKILFSSSFNFTLKNVQVDKNTYQISSGSATIRISCSATSGTISSSYSGTLTFTGNRHATLELDTLTYGINLLTGGMTK